MGDGTIEANFTLSSVLVPITSIGLENSTDTSQSSALWSAIDANQSASQVVSIFASVDGYALAEQSPGGPPSGFGTGASYNAGEQMFMYANDSTDCLPPINESC